MDTLPLLLVLPALLALWVFFIWASAGVARNKGRSLIIGGLMGGVFGVLGLVLMWLMPVNREVVARREQELRARLRTEGRGALGSDHAGAP
ncbi:MAG: hypothetical protein EXR65_02825 [Dehalococcoidia bacterium]|nr:hypothetical protein [Dehalococcoidia bacterium]